LTTTTVAGLANSGTVNAQGNINGAVFNQGSGTFNVTGTLTGDGSSFQNTNNAQLNVGANSFTNIGALTNSSVVNLNGGTLGTASISNSGVINAAGGTIGGTVSNTGTINTNGASFSGSVGNSGSIIGNGTTTIGGSFNNTGLVNLASTNNVTATTNKVFVNGQYSGTGGTLNVVYDLSSAAGGKAGEIIINGVAAGSTAKVSFANSLTNGSQTGIQLGSKATVISNTGAGTFANLTGTNQQFGLVNVVLQPTNGGSGAQLVALTSLPAAAAPGGSIVAALGAIDSSFHQSTAPFVASAQSMDPDKWTGGVWSRATTGQTTTKSVAMDSFGQQASLNVKTRFDAYEVGIDTGGLNLGGSGWNGHFGVTGGSVTATSNDGGTGTSVNFDLPFFGVYGVITHGPFFMDVEYRHDWLNTQVSNVTANLNNANLKGSGNSVSGSAGYHFNLVDQWFLEPSAGIAVTQTQFGSLVTNPGQLTTGTLSFDSMFSALAHAGARFGTSVNVSDVLSVQPFATLSVWRELGGQSSATFNTSAGTPDALAVSRVGTFYQAGLGVSAAVPDSNLFGFIRGDLRWGDNLNGASLVGGLRYSFGP
jgi:hypothetical protein